MPIKIDLKNFNLTQIDPTKIDPPKMKRPSKSQRTHTRRLKQEARTPGSVIKSNIR